jgi:hypothetical protein
MFLMRPDDYEVLAMRLLLAFLADDHDELAHLCGRVLGESGCTVRQFQVAVRTAREAASWWKDAGRAEDGRRRITAKLDKLMVPA